MCIYCKAILAVILNIPQSSKVTMCFFRTLLNVLHALHSIPRQSPVLLYISSSRGLCQCNFQVFVYILSAVSLHNQFDMYLCYMYEQFIYYWLLEVWIYRSYPLSYLSFFMTHLLNIKNSDCRYSCMNFYMDI